MKKQKGLLKKVITYSLGSVAFVSALWCGSQYLNRNNQNYQENIPIRVYYDVKDYMKACSNRDPAFLYLI